MAGARRGGGGGGVGIKLETWGGGKEGVGA